MFSDNVESWRSRKPCTNDIKDFADDIDRLIENLPWSCMEKESFDGRNDLQKDGKGVSLQIVSLDADTRGQGI